MSARLRQPVLCLGLGMFSALAVVGLFLYRDTLLPRACLAREHAVAAEISQLRGSGQYQEALHLGRSLEQELENDRRAAPWRKEDAIRLVATLEHIVSLPDSCRQALAEADRRDPVIARTLMDAEYRKGVVLANQQLDTRRRLLGADHPDVAVSLTALGELRCFQGDCSEALDLHSRALELRRKILGEKHPDVARSLELVGQMDQLLGRDDEARSHLQRSLVLRRELFGRKDPAVASSLNSLADLDRRLRHYDQAIRGFREALRMRRETLGSRHPDVVESLCDLGLTHFMSGDWKKAAPYLRQAVKLSRDVPGVSKETLALSLSLQVKILCKQGRYREAELGSREVIDLYEMIYEQGMPGAAPAHEFFPYTTLAVTQLMQGKGEEAWGSLEQGLNRVLLDESVLSDGNESRPSADPGVAPGRPRICKLETVQAALSEHAALIGWMDAYRNSSGISVYPLWGYVIRQVGPIQWVRIGPPDGQGEQPRSWNFGGLLTGLRGEAGWPFRGPVTPDLAQDARSVYEASLAPLERCLRGVDQLVVVQAMSWSQVPAEALMDSSGTWIGDRFSVSYTPSATLFARLREQRGLIKSPQTWHALAVGDPDFGPGAKDVETAGDLAAGQVLGPSRSRNFRRGDPGLRPRALVNQPGALGAVSPLPGSGDEVRRIARIFPSCTVLVGKEASKREITRLATSGKLEEYDLIHFATHAVMDPHVPTRSAILLSRTAPAVAVADAGVSSASDGVLTAGEIRSTWKLSADLVTLSACQTGTYSLMQETSLGLTGALLHAGARCVLVSLWDVDDRATCLLMGRFYEDLAGSFGDSRMGYVARPMPKAVALQEAKRWLREYLEADGSRPFASPAYWAAFILLGDAGDS